MEQLALAHLLMIIGEAASRVSVPTREKHPDIPWPRIVGMRHRLVHDYVRTDFGVVWDTATEDLQPLIAALEKLGLKEP